MGLQARLHDTDHIILIQLQKVFRISTASKMYLKSLNIKDVSSEANNIVSLNIAG